MSAVVHFAFLAVCWHRSFGEPNHTTFPCCITITCCVCRIMLFVRSFCCFVARSEQYRFWRFLSDVHLRMCSDSNGQLPVCDRHLQRLEEGPVSKLAGVRLDANCASRKGNTRNVCFGSDVWCIHLRCACLFCFADDYGDLPQYSRVFAGGTVRYNERAVRQRLGVCSFLVFCDLLLLCCCFFLFIVLLA